ncbi:hypothetical protein AGMMS50256_30390 [Betaproteobacteria bacterium]|nr:hypothetical protein AGMMS50256_30390 [Betaproteobacteria bacterium]
MAWGGIRSRYTSNNIDMFCEIVNMMILKVKGLIFQPGSLENQANSVLVQKQPCKLLSFQGNLMVESQIALI